MQDRKNHMWHYLMLAASTTALVCLPRFAPDNINLWMLLQWSVTYEDGFVFRGLQGSIIKMLFGFAKAHQIFIVGIITTLFYIAVLSAFIIWIYKNHKSNSAFLMLIFLIAQPFVTQWYLTSSMFERLDVVLTTIFIISLIIIVRARPVAIYISLLLLSVFAMLIHEGYAIYSIPTLFGIMLLSESLRTGEKPKLNLRPVLYYLLPIMIIYIIIVVTGKPDVPMDAFYSRIHENSQRIGIHENAVYSIFYMPFKEKIAYALGNMTKEKLLNLAGTIAFMAPSILVVSLLWRSAFRAAGSRLVKILLLFLIICTFSSVPAFFIAIDTMRWWGYIVYSNVFALCSLVMMNKKLSTAVLGKMEAIAPIAVFAVILALILGPTEYINGFNIVTKLIGYLLG